MFQQQAQAQHQPVLQQQQQNIQGNGYSSSGALGDISSNKNGAADATTVSNLDHALLESLFYNEMVTLEEPSPPLSSPPPTYEHDTPLTIVEKEILRDFGVGGGAALFPVLPEASSSATASAVTNSQYNRHTAHTPQETGATNAASGYSTAVMPLQQQQQQQQGPMHHQPSNPLHHQIHPAPTTTQQQQYANPTYGIPANGISNIPPPTATTQQHPPTQAQFQPGMVYVDPQATATAAAAAAAMLTTGGRNGGIKLQSTATVPPVDTALKTAPLPIAHPSPTAVAAQPSVFYPGTLPANGVGAAPPNPLFVNGVTTQQQQHKPHTFGSTENGKIAPGASILSGATVQVPEDRARKLVDQFATLASRLGIDLPDSVLQSLTSAAAKNNPNLLMKQSHESQTNGTATASAAKRTATTLGTVALNSGINPSRGTSSAAIAALETKVGGTNNTPGLPAMAPTVMELRNMAEEAIAAVTQSNISETVSPDNLSKVASSQAVPASANLAGSSNGNDNDNKPTYSKRRKKPRLSDCEAKLAQLKAENEQLKRHLQNVSNKAHKFDMEKEEAGKQIERLMHDPNAGPRDMDKSVRKFSDMYSDYGINRQQELSFHLEQLQRLVNPTNFTKMGLWTLGQSRQGAKNPIAGILVKELDITPQQGRKILDQSEKIRKLCDNLKEAHALLVKLKHLCEKKTRCFQDRMNKCTEILTSKQVVKLICWITDNAFLLEQVCPGWGTEHIQSKKKSIQQ